MRVLLTETIDEANFAHYSHRLSHHRALSTVSVFLVMLKHDCHDSCIQYCIQDFPENEISTNYNVDQCNLNNF